MTTEFKEACFQECIFILENKISSYNRDLELLKETSEGEQKSSMGDKYEITTELLAQEKRKLSDQVSLLLQQKNLLEKLYREHKTTLKINPGSLIETSSSGLYFLTTGIGKITVQNKDVIVLSDRKSVV